MAAALLLLLHCERLPQQFAAGSGRRRLGSRSGRGHLWLEGKAGASRGSGLPGVQVLAGRRAGTPTPVLRAAGSLASAAHPASQPPGARVRAGMKGAADPWLCVANEARPLAGVRLPRAGGGAGAVRPTLCSRPSAPGASRPGPGSSRQSFAPVRLGAGVVGIMPWTSGPHLSMRGLGAARKRYLERMHPFCSRFVLSRQSPCSYSTADS